MHPVRLALFTPLLAALALPGPAGGAASEDAWNPTPGGWVSGEVQYVSTIPFEAATGIDAVAHGDFLYATTWRSFSIYDISDPLNPRLLSQTPTPGQLINENPETNGEILLLSNDNVNRQLDIYDVREPAFPELIGSFEDSLNNHFWTCVLDCAYAYGGRGSILDLSDPTDPEHIGRWTDVGTPRGYHSISEIAPGLVLTGSNPMYYLDAREDPANPTLLAELQPKTTLPGRPYVIIGPAPTSLPARVAWPLGGQSRHVLVTMETPFSGACTDQSGTFLSYDSQGWQDEGFTLADEYAVTGNGLPNEGSAPVNAFGCSAYGMDANTAYEHNSLVATTWFEHGTRVLRVAPDGELVEVGGFLGAGGNAVRPLWLNSQILYVIDAARGIDILRVPSAEARYRDFPYAIDAGDLDGDGTSDTISGEATPETDVPEVGAVGFTHRVVARRGSNGSVLWERPDLAEEILPARLGPQAAPGVLLVDGVHTFTGGGGGTGDSGFGERGVIRELNLRAISGAGALLWERVFDPGVFVGAAVADEQEGRRQVAAAERFATFSGLMQATPSPAQDALVSVLTRRETPEAIETTLAVHVVDGATGALATSVTIETDGGRSAVHPAGDLDGDGLDDFVVLRDPTTGGVTARRGSNGAVIWTNPADIVPFSVEVEDLGDLDGDGSEELSIQGGPDFFEPGPPRATILDGATGSPLLSTDAISLAVVGELDDEGTIGVVTQRTLAATTDGVRYRLFALGGDLLAERTVETPAPPQDGSSSVRLMANLGDLNDDGLADVGHRVVITTPEAGTTETGMALSGATLATLFDGDAGRPLLASLDGGGDDLLRVTRISPTAFAVVAQDGAGGEAIWSATVPADDMYPLAEDVTVEAAQLDGDPIPDVLVNVLTSRRTQPRTGGSSAELLARAFALSGADGSLLWMA